jgi:hypothetical protein
VRRIVDDVVLVYYVGLALVSNGEVIMAGGYFSCALSAEVKPDHDLHWQSVSISYYLCHEKSLALPIWVAECF